MGVRVVTFKASEELLEALDRLARSRRESRSEVIREAIERYLREAGVEPRPRRVEPLRDPRILVFEVEV